MFKRKPSSINYKLDHITVELTKERNEQCDGLRFRTEIENWFIPNQTIEETKRVTEINYGIVKAYYKDKIGQVISEADLGNMCVRIVLYYFQMYNHWRTMYKRETKRDLTFLSKDFEHTFTAYQIIDHFKKMYPGTYAEKCEKILEMSPSQFKEYELEKDRFDNM